MKRINIYLIVTAVLLIALGIVCIFNPGAGFVSAAWLMGLFILASGISSLIFGLRAQAFLPNAGSTTLLAVFQIIIGLMLAANLLASEIALIAVVAMCLALREPEYTGTFLGILLGLGILANGIVRIVAFFGLRRIENNVRELQESATATPIDEINE